MEKDIGKIKKNPETDIVIRVDDFGGKRGLTIREFVSSERYTGFTKSGTRIPAESFDDFKKMINSIDSGDMKAGVVAQETLPPADEKKKSSAGVDESGLM